MAYIVCAVLMAGFAIGVVLAYEVYSVGTFADHEKMGVRAFWLLWRVASTNLRRSG